MSTTELYDYDYDHDYDAGDWRVDWEVVRTRWQWRETTAAWRPAACGVRCHHVPPDGTQAVAVSAMEQLRRPALVWRLGCSVTDSVSSEESVCASAGGVCSVGRRLEIVLLLHSTVPDLIRVLWSITLRFEYSTADSSSPSTRKIVHHGQWTVDSGQWTAVERPSRCGGGVVGPSGGGVACHVSQVVCAA
jgi:hypothetical protein